MGVPDRHLVLDPNGAQAVIDAAVRVASAKIDLDAHASAMFGAAVDAMRAAGLEPDGPVAVALPPEVMGERQRLIETLMGTVTSLTEAVAALAEQAAANDN